ncbi:MAG TPA: polysaccharide deacetylase family protein [Gemmatimonadaceae bacterium]|nr:polysaccharide deacetylase family protein [Gemmatimonadaceae bacterium]
MSAPRFFKTRRFVLVLLAAAGVLIYLAPRGWRKLHPRTVYVFPGVEGPATRTRIADPIEADWRSFHVPGDARLAILLTDTASPWLGLARGLSTIGVPFTITRDWREAVRHHVVWVYPRISGRLLPAEGLRAIAAVPRNGGTLLANEVLGGGLEEMFGFASAQPSRLRRTMRMTAEAIARFGLADSAEQVLRIGRATGSGPLHNSAIGSYSYRPTTAQSLALFEDGSTAITHRAIGAGHAYILGIDVGQLFVIGYENREEGLARTYVNQYEPSVDVMLRMVRNIYREGEPNAVILWTVPYGKSLSVVFTHDIDYAKAWKNAISFAEMEAKRGIRATNFIQTKYVRDWNDEIFFDSSGIRYARRLDSLGMEIASHSVAHSRQFDVFKLGNGKEQYPSYQPFVLDSTRTEDATVLGELRVSKFLLESQVGRTVVSFRPGHLSNPYALPQALEATGFRYSSSVTANNSLTHLPFRLTYNREGEAETDIYEFPVTIEDEEAPKMDKRFANGLALARKIGSYGGLFVVLIHPNVTAEKFAYERDLADSLKNEAWFGSVDQFGPWWAMRDQIKVDVTAGDSSSATVTLDPKWPTKGVAIEVPDQWRLVTDPGIPARQDGRRVVVAVLAGRTELRFTRP